MYFNRDQEEGQLRNLGDTPNFKNSFGAPGFTNPFRTSREIPQFSEASPSRILRRLPVRRLTGRLHGHELHRSQLAVVRYNFNLNVQRQLSNTMILQIGYVGSLGHKLATGS